MVLNPLSTQYREPAECVIRVGKSRKEIKDLYPFLTEVTVECGRKESDTATMKFEFRRDESGKITVLDDGDLTPWEPIIIEAAFGNAPEEVMRGYIREVNVNCPENAADSAVVVECQDDSIKLDREHVRKVWGGDAPTSDSVIVSTIVSDKYSLKVDSESGEGQTGIVINQDNTDIRLLRERAEANGYELLFREGEVYFGPMRLEGTVQANIMVYAGRATNCYNFKIRDDGHQPDRVGFDRPETEGSGNVKETVDPNLPSLGSEYATSSGMGLRDFIWRMSRQGGMNEAEWMARAKRKANDLSLRIRAEGQLDGSLYGHVLQVGKLVGVDGMGEHYGGIYYVDTVKHEFTMDGYKQTFTLLRNAYGDNL